MEISDTQLVIQAQAGDPDAFAALVQRHREPILRLLRRCARGAEDAQDLAQETFVVAFRNLATLRQPEMFRPWLQRIAINAARQWWRHELQISFEPLWEGFEPSARASSDPAVIGLQEAVREALHALPPEPRSAVLLHYFEGYDYGETAALLDVPVSTVRGRLHTARCKLREELAELAPQKKKSAAHPPAAQAFELTVPDLTALCGAELLASRDPARPVIQTVCIEPDGTVVSTDTHRLYVFRGSSLRPASRVLVDHSLFGWLRHRAQMASARLTLSEDEATLHFLAPYATPQEHAPRAALVTEGPYPNYERVIPTDSRVTALVSCRDLLAALEEVARFEAFLTTAALPDAGHEGQRLTLTFSADAGSVLLQAGAMKPHPAPTRWAMQVELAIEQRGLKAGEELTLALNRHYLRECVQALHIPAAERIELHLNSPHLAVRIQPEGTPDHLTVLMPMRLHLS